MQHLTSMCKAPQKRQKKPQTTDGMQGSNASYETPPQVQSTGQSEDPNKAHLIVSTATSEMESVAVT